MASSGGLAPVVCDNGTGFVKCGFGGDNFPRFHFPSLVGRPILRANLNTKKKKVVREIKDIMVGDECSDCLEYLKVT